MSLEFRDSYVHIVRIHIMHVGLWMSVVDSSLKNRVDNCVRSL